MSNKISGQIKVTNRLRKGDSRPIMDLCPTAAGSVTHSFTIETDTVLVSLGVESVAGTLDVVVFTEDGKGGTTDIITFPTISAATGSILLRKAGLSLANVQVRATYTGAAKFHVVAKAIDGADNTVTIAAPATLRATKQIITGAVPTELIPASLSDREGIIMRSYNTTETFFIAESAAKLTAGEGYHIKGEEPFAVDVAAGVSVFALGEDTGATIDIRILEAGG